MADPRWRRPYYFRSYVGPLLLLALQLVAKDYRLTFALFADNPTPSLNDTMTMFHSAVVVVAPHGAGLSNVLFSQPGTYVVEGVCNRPKVNLCYKRLAHVLGHHWHGIMSRRGCPIVVNVSPPQIDYAVREYLRLWSAHQVVKVGKMS